MKVSELMTREVKTCTANDSLNDAARAMWDNDCGCVPILGDDSRLIGLVTDRDVCMAAYTQGRKLSDIQVTSSMSTNLFTCRESDDLTHAEAIMRDEKVRRLPVVDAHGRLVGILSLNDLARKAVGESAAREHGVTLDEVGETLGDICALRVCTIRPAGERTAKAERSLTSV